MVSALVSGSSGPGSSPSRKHCVVLLGKTLYSFFASLHPRVQMSTGESKLNARGTLRWTRGRKNTPTCFMLYELMGLLVSMQDLTST